MSIVKPQHKPSNPCFSSGPTTKFKDWDISALSGALTGRSHRSSAAKKRMQLVLDKMRSLLKLPDEYKIGILPGSDTGAFEAAMWCLLGQRPVDVFAWENFGLNWVKDALNHLKIDNVTKYTADYGLLPDLTQVNFDHDVIFTWNGTTSGVKVPNGDWISGDRSGLTLCDATSAVFAMDLPWDKLDVTTFSWQKVLGGEAQHGVIIMSPRAIERLNSYVPEWPVPILFQLARGGVANEKVYQANTINTPSMICIEDALLALNWVEENGGLDFAINKSQQNLKTVEQWVEKTQWVDFLCEKEETRSSTSICLKIVSAEYQSLNEEIQSNVISDIVSLLESEEVGYDFKAYRSAPAGFRIWGGATVEADDIAALLEWLDWAYAQVMNEKAKAA